MKGAALVSTVLGSQIYALNLLASDDFCAMSYDYFNLLSTLGYGTLMHRVFNASAHIISRKDKIKIGFVLYDSAMWCGDDLYNFFANDLRFEPTIFLCLRTDKLNDELIREQLWHGVEQFKSRGLNVMPIVEQDFIMPEQDMLILLTPYFDVLPPTLQLSRLSARTLLAYIPYGVQISTLDLFNISTYRICQKFFLESKYHLKLLEDRGKAGRPHGYYSGYPKLDYFFKRHEDFKFVWKMTRPDAKKIIWAPHWSINDGVLYATFQWNYRFMYEFAQAHPEIMRFSRLPTA